MRVDFAPVFDADRSRSERGRAQDLVRHPGTGHLAVDQSKARGGRTVPEEAFAGADNDRKHQQVVLVDQSRVVQGACELPAAVNLQIPARFVLERLHGIDNVGRDRGRELHGDPVLGAATRACVRLALDSRSA